MAGSALRLLLCCAAALLAAGTGDGGHRGGPVSPAGSWGRLGSVHPAAPGGWARGLPPLSPAAPGTGGGWVWVLRGYGGGASGCSPALCTEGAQCVLGGGVSMAPRCEVGEHRGGGPYPLNPALGAAAGMDPALPGAAGDAWDGGGLHPLPGGPRRPLGMVPLGACWAGGKHPAPPTAGSTVGQDAAPALPNRLGRLVLTVAWVLRHRLGTPGANGPSTLCCCGLCRACSLFPAWAPSGPSCTPGCLGSPISAWKLAPNTGCSALGSPPSGHRVAAGWERPVLVSLAAVGTPSTQPHQPPWVLALGAGSALGHFALVSPMGPGWICSFSCENRTLADKGAAIAA